MKYIRPITLMLFGTLATIGLTGCEQAEQAIQGIKEKAEQTVEEVKQSATQVVAETQQAAGELLGQPEPNETEGAPEGEQEKDEKEN